MPAGHGVHWEDPMTLEYLPDGQEIAPADPAGQYPPAVHGVPAVDPGEQNIPAGHDVHWEDPVTEE